MIRDRHAAALLSAAMVLSACSSDATVVPLAELPSTTIAPPTLAATPTPPPPTSTATLQPAPRIFTQGFESAAPHWQFMQAGASQDVIPPSVQSGTLRFEFPGPNQWAYGIYSGPQYDDVRIDAVVDFAGGTDVSVGLICRYRVDLGWYEFNIHPDGTYAILFGQWLAEGIARYTPLVVSESESIDPVVNEIGLICQGNIITPMVNSVQLRRRQETQRVLVDGQVGVSAGSAGADGQAAAFDWISAGPP